MTIATPPPERASSEDAGLNFQLGPGLNENGNENTRRIALIICSTRTKRIGPQIAAWLRTRLPVSPNIVLETIDLAFHLPTLPLSPNDPALPYYIPTPLSESPYVDEGTNAWSRLVRGFDGFIFLTPEYNFCFPAGVKVGIDGLFWEWAKRVVLVVSYGNEGGAKSGDALRGVLKGVRVHEWDGRIELPLGYGESIERAVKGELIGSVVQMWEQSGKGKEVENVWAEMIEVVGRVGGKVRGNGERKVAANGNIKAKGCIDESVLKGNVVMAGPLVKWN